MRKSGPDHRHHGTSRVLVAFPEVQLEDVPEVAAEPDVQGIVEPPLVVAGLQVGLRRFAGQAGIESRRLEEEIDDDDSREC